MKAATEKAKKELNAENMRVCLTSIEYICFILWLLKQSFILLQQESKTGKKPKDIKEYLKYVCRTKLTARKENNEIYLSSLTDCVVKVTDFSCERGFMG